MQNFVNQRAFKQPEPKEIDTNGAAKPSSPDFGDLKVNMKAWPTANKGQARSKQPQPSQLGQHAALYGADVSSIGDTSTNPSPDAVKREAYDKATGQASNAHAEVDADHSEGEFTDGRQLDDEPDEDNYGGLAPYQAEMDDAVAQGWQHGLPHMKGDSFPSTTSGPPSPTGLPELNALPEPRPSKRQPTGQPKTRTRSLMTDGTFQRRNVETEPAEQFKFQQVPIRASLTKKQITAPIIPEHPTNAQSTNTAHRDSAPSMSSIGHPANAQTAQAVAHTAPASQQRNTMPAPRQTAKQESHVTVQQSQPIPTPVQQSSGNYADEEDEDELDYDPTTLLTMDYTELKAQSFDTDPNNPRSGRKQGQTLQSRLQAVSEAPQQKQYDFFLALPLQEWEEAGDWLLERFGEVLSNFKAVRQEKREAARGFEEEIAKRYDAVGKKRKQTEAQLNEMRENGRELLQGTPKRMKTK